jgi:diguanylate cyclase (GGDEF)-like protein
VGDEILAGIARVLKENVRKADIVARFGGEEFLILLVDIREGEAVQVAEKLRKKVAEHPFDTKAGVLKKTISIGVSEFPVDSKGIWQVIKFADVALYKAKETGRNRVVRFQPKMWKKEQQTEEEVSSQKGGSNEKGTG